MKIAVIGAGISGLSAAYYLSRAHQVQLFEKNNYFGGHAHTVDWKQGAQAQSLDTGFLVCNAHTYPNFLRLLAELGIETQNTDMSFSVQCRRCGLEYRPSSLAGYFAQPSSWLRPRSYTLGWGIYQFFRQAQGLLQDPAWADKTLGDYLKHFGPTSQAARHFILPLGAAIWSSSFGKMYNFPLAFFIRFLLNHGMLGLNTQFQWMVIKGGSREYVKAILARLPQPAQASNPVLRVRRQTQGVELQTADGAKWNFDLVVLACHSDQALALLADPSEQETRLLSSIPYTRNRVVVHQDTNQMPRREKAWASWNYQIQDCLVPQSQVTLSYHLNSLMGLRQTPHYIETLNPSPGVIAKEKTLFELEYEHPLYTLAGVQAQNDLADLNGQRHTYYCGAYLGYGFHEDGIVSALKVVRHIAPQLAL